MIELTYNAGYEFDGSKYNIYLLVTSNYPADKDYSFRKYVCFQNELGGVEQRYWAKGTLQKGMTSVKVTAYSQPMPPVKVWLED